MAGRIEGASTFESSIKSPSWLSSSWPTGVSSETGSSEVLRIERTFSTGEAQIARQLLVGRVAAQLLEHAAAGAHAAG